MSLKIKITQELANDLKELSNLSHNKISELAGHLTSMEGPLVRPIDILNMFKSILPNSEATILLRYTMTMAEFKRDKKVSADELLDSTIRSVKTLNWADEDLKALESIKADLVGLVKHDIICAASKMMNISQDYESILKTSRVITDIRPVWSDTDEIIGSIITQTLRIDYQKENEHLSIALGMDEKDLKNLQDWCVRALAKAEQAKRLMIDGCEIKTYISGDELYE